MKDLEKVKIRAKNEANETICKMNKQIVLERAKIFSEHQENSKNLAEEFKMKEDRLNKSLNLLNQSLNLLEEREQAWQHEKSEVLKEVQRLEEEATKMARILAMEYDDGDKLSDQKKMSLNQELYSLKLVLEMKTGEVINLREEITKAKQKLDQAVMNEEKLQKATARIEDLEEQLRIKKKNER